MYVYVCTCIDVYREYKTQERINMDSAIINPQRMREGYGSWFVCLSVCYHASCYIPCLRVQFAVL